MPALPKNIDEVITTLDQIIETSLSENSFLGIFAFVYRNVTAEIKLKVEEKFFEDNERMEHFDVQFANLYIDAYQKYQAGLPISKSWQISFDSQHDSLSILQHLLMGINAHINLDLGIAAAKIMAGKDIDMLKNDFDKVNDILFSMTNSTQDQLSNVSRMMFLLDWLGKRKDEKIIDFSMKEARMQAWRSAKMLWASNKEEQAIKTSWIDNTVLRISNVIQSPKSRLLKYVLKLIHFFEVKDVKQIIAGLKAHPLLHSI